MISTVFLVNHRGRVLIHRFFRDDVDRKCVDVFKANVITAKEVRTPVMRLGDTSFFFVKLPTVFFVAVSKRNANAALVFEYLYAMIGVLKGYFGENFTDDTIGQNFALVYELLDEILDFGYPQTTDVDILKMFIHTQGNNVLAKLKKKEPVDPNAVSTTVTGQNSWRPEGLKYRKNELFIDVIESVNLLVSASGTDLRADVSGKVVMKAFLSGMPECKLGVNDKLVMEREGPGPTGGAAGAAVAAVTPRKMGITIDDCKFHQCVRLGKWDTDRSVSFVPPDGEFELMSYRITDHINAPFRLTPIINVLGRTRLEVRVGLRALFSYQLFGTNVVIKIPVPKNTATADVDVSVGKAKFSPPDNAIVWKIRRVQGATECMFNALVELNATVTETKAWSRPPISMQFQVPMFTSSGLFVRFLKVQERSQYIPVKWVRYITQAGTYEQRI